MRCAGGHYHTKKLQARVHTAREREARVTSRHSSFSFLWPTMSEITCKIKFQSSSVLFNTQVTSKSNVCGTSRVVFFGGGGAEQNLTRVVRARAKSLHANFDVSQPPPPTNCTVTASRTLSLSAGRHSLSPTDRRAKTAVFL